MTDYMFIISFPFKNLLEIRIKIKNFTAGVLILYLLSTSFSYILSEAFISRDGESNFENRIPVLEISTFPQEKPS